MTVAERKIHTCVIESATGNCLGLLSPNRDRKINSETAEHAAVEAVKQWRRERDFFSCDSGNPSVVVDGIEFVPVEYAGENDNYTYEESAC